MIRFLFLSLFFFSLTASNFDAYRQRAWSILEEGSRKEEVEIQLLTLFGAKLSMDEGALTLYMRGLKSSHPEVQLAAIRSLAALKDDRADEAIQEGLRSNEIIIRLETLHLMAQRGMPGVADQVEGLMAKIPRPLHAVFPPLFAIAGDPSSLKRLRLLLSDPDDRVRASAVFSVEKGGFEEFLPHVRRLAKQVSPLVQEAALHCLGAFGDTGSLATIRKMVSSPYQEVRNVALQALASMDEEEALPLIAKEAERGDLFAIALLGKIPGAEKTLKPLLRSSDPLISINGAMALLERGDKDGLKIIAPFLLSRHGSLIPQATPLKNVIAWKVISSGPYDEPIVEEKVREVKREVLRRIFLLSEQQSLYFAKEALDRGERDLLPAVMEQLYLLATPSAITLLEKYQQKIGAPFVRGEASLTLFKLGQKERRKELISFLKSHHEVELIQIKPMLENPIDPFSTPFELSPLETSALYIEMLEALLTEGKEDGIALLMEAMDKGHPNNKYALAGLLIRATL